MHDAQKPLILVLGAKGQVGTALMRRQWPDDCRVAGFSSTEFDITNEPRAQMILSAARPALVINCAAYTAVDRAESEPEKAFAVNRDGPAILAAACAETGAALLHLSTDYVFRGDAAAPYLETDAVDPQGVYARSKADGEAALRVIGGRIAILRLSWIFSATGTNFLRTMLRLGAERPLLRIVHDQVGGPTWAGHAAEVIAAMAARLLADPRALSGVYHYADAPDVSWYEFATAIFAAAAARGLKPPALEAITSAEYPSPVPRPASSRMDCGRLMTALGMQRADWHRGVEACLAELLPG